MLRVFLLIAILGLVGIFGQATSLADDLRAEMISGRQSLAAEEAPWWISFAGPDSSVRIQVRSDPGMLGGGVSCALSAAGTGVVEYFLGARGETHGVDSLRFEPSDIQGLLTLFYESHFFDLGTSYQTLVRPVRDEDGRWRVALGRWHDVGTTTITVTLGEDAKQVTFSRSGNSVPPQLRALADSVEVFVETRTGKKYPW